MRMPSLVALLWLAVGVSASSEVSSVVAFILLGGRSAGLDHTGGSQPRWGTDGKELFYLALDGAMMSVNTRDSANPGAPRKLFEPRFRVNPVDDQYDVAADGQRFLLIVPEIPQAMRLTVLINWASVLNGR